VSSTPIDEAEPERAGQKIALDCRTHPQERILHPEISDTQGPAVLAYNNSVFKKEDWNAIQFIGHSSKTKSTS
jgi:sacsin